MLANGLHPPRSGCRRSASGARSARGRQTVRDRDRSIDCEEKLLEQKERELQFALTRRRAEANRADAAEKKLAEQEVAVPAEKVMSKSDCDRTAAKIAARWVGEYHADDIAILAMDVIRKASKALKKDLKPGIKKSTIYKKLREQIFTECDGQVYAVGPSGSTADPKTA